MRKNRFITATIILLSALIPQTTKAQLQTEKMTPLYSSDGKEKTIIMQGKSFVQEVQFDKQDFPVRRTLRVVGGIETPGRFAPRGEEFFRQQESLIDENLDSLNVRNDRYSLYFKGDGDPFERHIYNRVTGVDFSSGEVNLEMAFKRKNLKVLQGGDFGIELQIYKAKKGRHADDVYDKADTTVYISIPEGSGNFKTLKSTIKLPANTATVLIRIGGTNFKGECWIEAPQLFANGNKVFYSPFIQNDRRIDKYNYWVGINMATRSWPLWRLEYNGKKIFEGYIFDRASNNADFYINLPQNISGKGNLKLTLLKEPNRRAFPYRLLRMQLIEESARDFEIASVPKFVTVGDTSAILIETNRENVEMTLFSENPNIEIVDKNIVFEKTGLHTVRIAALGEGVSIPITISDGNDTRVATINQLIIKNNDNVYLSSGDEIHIDKEFDQYDKFFKWYFRYRIGNWYHFRPSYQWSGVRITNPLVIKHYTSLLNDMKVPYAWQVEGRTLASTKINPPIADLQSPMFRGKQAHENDGGYYYWQHFLYNGFHSDMAARTRPFGGIFAKHRPIYTDHGNFIHYDPYAATDMAEGASIFVSNLSYSRGESTRHTGPSTMFRYLYQAGYQWLGAEQMYGPEDVIMSSLRGASRAYGKDNYGSLHAVQWGSGPFTDPKHSHRLFMSLATSYIHGGSHINTEEGLWTDEFSNDRYTLSGNQHLYAQNRMLDYIETHSRVGKHAAKIAVIQGRNDAWKSFGRTSIWSQNEDKWKFNTAMESFDLLKVFYPENNLSYCSKKGLFTRTPYGHIDLLPIEAGNDVMNQYKAIIFLGWNTFDTYDFVRLRKYVENGGTLIMTAAHINTNLQPDSPTTFPKEDTAVKSLLGDYYQLYESKQVISLGKGTIIYYPQNIYPADSIIRESYTKDLNEIAKQVTENESTKGWIKSAENINFATWDSDNMRTIYLLNIDWDSDIESHPATLLLGKYQFEIAVERYTIATIRCIGDKAYMMPGNTSDIIKVTDDAITCQTTEADKLYIFDGATGKSRVVEIEGAGVHHISQSLSK